MDGVFWFLVLIVGAVLAAIPAKIAEQRGLSGSPVLWFIGGFFLWPITLLAALLAKPDPKAVEEITLRAGAGKKCPRCAEVVKSEAAVCRFCSYAFPAVRQGEMPCPQCGQSILREAVRCRHCGKALRARQNFAR